jgi:hypothetical protein
MLDIFSIDPQFDLPQDQRCILVAFGKKNDLIRQGHRVVISINPGELSDQLAEKLLSIAIENAKAVAMKEGFKKIYVCRSRIN